MTAGVPPVPTTPLVAVVVPPFAAAPPAPVMFTVMLMLVAVLVQVVQTVDAGAEVPPVAIAPPVPVAMDPPVGETLPPVPVAVEVAVTVLVLTVPLPTTVAEGVDSVSQAMPRVPKMQSADASTMRFMTMAPLLDVCKPVTKLVAVCMTGLLGLCCSNDYPHHGVFQERVQGHDSCLRACF